MDRTKLNDMVCGEVGSEILLQVVQQVQDTGPHVFRFDRPSPASFIMPRLEIGSITEDKFTKTTLPSGKTVRFPRVPLWQPGMPKDAVQLVFSLLPTITIRPSERFERELAPDSGIDSVEISYDLSGKFQGRPVKNLANKLGIANCGEVIPDELVSSIVRFLRLPETELVS